MNSYLNIGAGGTYLSAYSIAVKHGYTGTEEDWLQSLKGESTELKYDSEADVLLWRNDEEWQVLMSLEELRGELIERTLTDMEVTKEAIEKIFDEVKILEGSSKENAESAGQSNDNAQQSKTSAEQAANSAIESKEAAALSANSAKGSLEEIEDLTEETKEYKNKAWLSAESAGVSSELADRAATTSESWAVGGTESREGEDSNNAKYWAARAQDAAGGGVMSFNLRSGAVMPQSGDYTAEMVGADTLGSAGEVKEMLIPHLDSSAGTEAGAHGIRYFDDKLSFYSGEEWQEIKTVPSYVYRCTGEQDDVKISTLVNDFLQSCADYNEELPIRMNMKLVVVGDVGLSDTPQYGSESVSEIDLTTNPRSFFRFGLEDNAHANNSRVHIDWSGAVFKDYMSHNNNPVIMNHKGQGYDIWHSGLRITLDRMSVSGVPFVIYNQMKGDGGRSDTSRVYLDNCYFDTSSYVLANGGSMYILNSTAASGSTTCLVNGYDGKMYISNSKCGSYSSNVIRNEGGLLQIVNSHLIGNIASEGGSTSYISNSEINTHTQGVAVRGNDRLYMNNCYCGTDKVAAIAMYDDGEAHISGSYIKGTIYGIRIVSGEGFSLHLESCRCEGGMAGIYTPTTGNVYISNSHCIGKNTSTTVAENNAGHGVLLDADWGIKLFAVNSRFEGYHRIENTSGKSSGIYARGYDDPESTVLVLQGCNFGKDKKVINEGYVQTDALRLGNAQEDAPKYSITGCSFFTSGVNYRGSNITGNGTTGATRKYMPDNANFFGVSY